MYIEELFGYTNTLSYTLLIKFIPVRASINNSVLVEELIVLVAPERKGVKKVFMFETVVLFKISFTLH